MAEEYLQYITQVAAILRLNELADHRNFDGAHQVGKEYEAVLQHAEYVDRLPFVVVGNVPRQLTHTFLNLVGGDDDMWFSGLCDLCHRSEYCRIVSLPGHNNRTYPCPAELFPSGVSRISTPAPFFA